MQLSGSRRLLYTFLIYNQSTFLELSRVVSLGTTPGAFTILDLAQFLFLTSIIVKLHLQRKLELSDMTSNTKKMQAVLS